MTRTVVITGTTTGLGRATVEKFTDEGWNVVATVRKPADMSIYDDQPNVKTGLLLLSWVMRRSTTAAEGRCLPG